MQPGPTHPESATPRRIPPLTRYAIWTAVVTVGVPLVWAVLTSSLGGNTGLEIGWFGVLPVILFVPIGSIVTLVLVIASFVQTNTPRPGDSFPGRCSTRRNDGIS